MSRTMKYLILFTLSVLLIGKVYAQEYTPTIPDTSYVLIPISESCKNIVFTDSMYKAWNTASIENIKSSLLKDSNECLMWLIPLFTKGENSRLLFLKTLNNDSLITKEDFTKGFFIIEEIVEGSMLCIQNYFIVSRENMIKKYYFRFSNVNCTWDLKMERVINKYKFYRFFHKIKKQNRNDNIYPIQKFIVTKFTEEKIESYVFACDGCNKYINLFYKMGMRCKKRQKNKQTH